MHTNMECVCAIVLSVHITILACTAVVMTTHRDLRRAINKWKNKFRWRIRLLLSIICS